MAITVQVQQGTLAGTASADGVVRAFLGVPYAQPPVGPLRWRLPQPPAPWEGQRPADSFGPNSPQFPMLPNSLFAGGHENQSEDCLYLNVWTAAQSAQERRPVIVFVHLGAFQYGGSSLEIYGGESLARQGPVVVTINYRLNRFGFFAHPDLSRESPHGASGNYGLHDQIAALQWIRANIGAFGGDQDCVTMFGVSAGGVSINALMASPLARGLFHRAISGSGSALGRLGTSSGLSESLQDLESAERTGVAIAKQLGVSTLEQLRAVAPDDLMMAPAPASGTVEWFYEAPAQPFARGGLDGGYPVIDGYLLPERPFDIYARGAQAQIPLMTGSTAGEAGAAPYIQTLERFNADARETYGPMLEEYLALYPAHNDDEARRASAQTFADQIFISGNWTHARLHSRAQDVYYYQFARVPPFPPGLALAESEPGAFHSADLPYVMRNFAARDWPWQPVDREISEAMSTMWMNFASTGNPNGPGLPEWAKFDAAAPQLLMIADDGTIEMSPVPRREFFDFWDRAFGRDRELAVAAA